MFSVKKYRNKYSRYLFREQLHNLQIVNIADFAFQLSLNKCSVDKLLIKV